MIYQKFKGETIMFYKIEYDEQYPSVSYDNERNYLDHITCPVFGHMKAYRNNEKLLIEIKKKKMGDFVPTPYSEMLITDRTAELFEKYKLTGYELREVDVRNKVLSFKLWEIIHIGKAQIHPDCGVKEVYRCEHCGIAWYHDHKDETGIIIDEDTWDGSDFFMTEAYPVHHFVSEKVKKMIDEERLTGALLIPSTEIRFPEFIEKTEADFTKEQWKEVYESGVFWWIKRWKEYFETRDKKKNWTQEQWTEYFDKLDDEEYERIEREAMEEVD
jgi:hypothetical protein